MLTVKVTLAAQGFFNTIALGGLAIFTPPAVEVTPGTLVVMTVELSTESLSSGGFNGADVLIGSDDVPFSIQVNEALWSGTICDPVPCQAYPVGIYRFDFFVGWANPNRVFSAVSLGTLSANTTGLAAGVYTIGIDSDRDGLSRLGRGLPGQPFVSEPLFGQGRITIVPEQGMLLMMACAGTVSIGWRRDGAKHSD